MSGSVLLAAGGTGGHLVPALAVAAALRRAAPDVRITFVGTNRGIERLLLPPRGERLLTTSMAPFGRGVRAITGPLSMIPATFRALRIVRDERPGCVVGFGGYASLPVAVAGRLRRVPLLVHEQNAIPGLANQVAARLTRHVAVSFPESAPALRSARVVGLPLRAEIARLDREAARPVAYRELDLDSERRTVLVFGGSIGAARINEAAVSLAERWRDRDDVQLIVVAGHTHAVEIGARLPDGKLLVRVTGFIDRMELAYAAADVVVARAGASTVAELAATGSPSILVPYPHARRREQDANARALAGPGAAIVVPDPEATGERLATMLDPLLADDERRAAMSDAARAVARPGAADELAGWILDLAGGPRG